MSEFYPYIQALNGFDPSIESYAIQPVIEGETAILPEEDPMIAFGPLGYINIFVGATNAGKSRFLRTVAKREEHLWMHSANVHQQIHRLVAAAHFLAQAEGFLTYEVTFGAHQWTNKHGQTPIDSQLPQWAKSALGAVNYGSHFKEVFDKRFFQVIIPEINAFLSERLSQVSARTTSSASNLGLGDGGSIAKGASALLKGELAARRQDAVGRSQDSTTGRNVWQSLEKRVTSDDLKLDFANTDDRWQTAFITFWEMVDELWNVGPPEIAKPPARFYIPVLRSAVSLHDNDGKRLTYDIFEETVRRNYRLEESSLKIFTGNRLYDTLRRDRNGTPEVVSRLRDFEKFLGDAFYEGRRVEIVALDEAYEAGQHISVRVQGETPRELHDLGDGINTLVILLYQLFMADAGSWIFIEEPELNLHPGLQRVFLQTLLENEALQKRKLRVFFTTHSNHLLRMTLRDGTIAASDISVFAFQQRASDKDRFLIRPLVSKAG